MIKSWLLYLSLIVFSVQPVIADKRALVIGNAAYTKEQPLVNTLNDAKDMAQKLKELGFKVTHFQNLAQLEMRQQVEKFLYEVEHSKDTVLIYFSGHGVQDRHHNSYLLPIDAKIQQEYQIKSAGVSLNDMLAQLKNRPMDAVNLVIVDACRNNPFASKRGAKGLGRVAPTSGTLVLYAAGPGQTAEDNPSGRNGLFTKHLLATLGKPGLDIEDAFENTAIQVRNATNREQIPYKEGNLLGKFYLNDMPYNSPEMTNAESSINAEIIFWKSIETQPDKASYQAYLKQWPNGKFASLAKLRIGEPEQKSNQHFLDDEEILATFSGNTVKGYHHRKKYLFQNYFDADGSLSGFNLTRKKYFSGTWKAKDGKLCRKWDKQKLKCGKILEVNGKIQQFDPYDNLSITYESILKGNTIQKRSSAENNLFQW